MPSTDRPLSPHLQVYRPQITSVLSILHRGTGVVLSLGLPFLVYWLVAAAAGATAWAEAQNLLSSVVGQLALLGWTFAFCYHLCNGIRHLAWDIGWGFELPQVHRSGWMVVIGAFVLTAGTWLLAGGLS